ncbi:hypothetical protein [Pedobacter arcticus]|uniref:hypothetical protein n=1 Tax=Pedobacter arcticus TaxID=752140 RepID=UPI000374C607|nr:hypothetical protein [Pedobacter arcticus]
MILQKSLTMIPLIVGISSSTFHYDKTDIVFNEKDIKNNLIISDVNPKLFQENLSSMDYDNNYLENQLKTLVKKWKNETLVLSDVHKIMDNNNFKQILSFKLKALPFLLNELKERPSTLVWAINMILDRKISNQALSIKDASKAWVNWGIQNNLIA